jgi:hypothetical protein
MTRTALSGWRGSAAIVERPEPFDSTVVGEKVRFTGRLLLAPPVQPLPRQTHRPSNVYTAATRLTQ